MIAAPPLSTAPVTAAAVVLPLRALSPSSGSATVTTTGTPEPAAPPERERAPDGTLRLRGAELAKRRRKVKWGEEVIDNEGLGRKKSKVCCIYHRPRDFGESSSEDSDSSSSDDDGDSSGDEGHAAHRGCGHGLKPRKNAYEKMPRNPRRNEHGGGGGGGPVRA